jgi:hypothetical protein
MIKCDFCGKELEEWSDFADEELRILDEIDGIVKHNF